MTDHASGSGRGDEGGPADAHCYLVCFPARPIRLHRERPTTIGRADGNTIVLADSDVSRKHAVIEWGDGHFVVRDLSSRNGVFVNDVRVSEAPLAPDDKVRIGSRVFGFIVGDEQAVKRLFLRKRQEKHGGGTEVVDAQALARPTAGFAGSLSDFGLAELLQALELGRKTGKVTVVCDAGRGEMLIKGGQVIRAVLGERRNEEAVYWLIGLENGRFEFENRPVDETPEILTKTASLLMEGFRLMDEAQRASTAGTPPAETPPDAAGAPAPAGQEGGSAAAPAGGAAPSAPEVPPGAAGAPAAAGASPPAAPEQAFTPPAEPGATSDRNADDGEDTRPG